MPDLDLGWGHLRYEDKGFGEPVLLVSGLNGLAAPWGQVAAALAPRFRVITHDHRGLGGSSSWPGIYSVDQMVLSGWQTLPGHGSVPSMTTGSGPYRGFRFPAEVIQHAVWHYTSCAATVRPSVRSCPVSSTGKAAT